MAAKKKVSSLEKELVETTSIKQGPKESRGGFLKKLYKKFNDMVDADETLFGNMSQGVQDWVNAAIHAENKDKDLPDFDWQDPVDAKPDAKDEKSDETETKKEDEDSSKDEKDEDEDVSTTKKGGKKVAAKKPAAPAKKPAAKPAAKKAVPKAAKSGNGKPGATGPWLKILNEVAKKGDKGVTREEMFAIVKKQGMKPLYARFVDAGYLKRVARGVVAITADGKKFLADANKEA